MFKEIELKSSEINRVTAGKKQKLFLINVIPLEKPRRQTIKISREIRSRVGRKKATVLRICDRSIQEGTMDRRGRSHPPQCTTSREDSVCAYHSTPFTADWSVRTTSIPWSNLDAESQMSSSPMVR
ncbi:uncharacterized protein TNCV_3184691 [Trichonephila clavipes]|nr:uncharacterized protein TNCV_3184691 [Trichonephila clavipes]